MTQPSYIIGVDLGTTDSVVAYTLQGIVIYSEAILKLYML